MVTIYKIDGSKSLELEGPVAVLVEGLWHMYHEDFTTMPKDYFVRFNDKRVFLKEVTLNKPETVKNSELSLDK